MIQIFKTAHNYYEISLKNLTFKNNNRLRGHNFTIVKKETNKTSQINLSTE